MGQKEDRKDFNKESRIVRMVKWPKGFKFLDHSDFIQDCTRNEFDQVSTLLFYNAYEEEAPYRIKERQKKSTNKD